MLQQPWWNNLQTWVSTPACVGVDVPGDHGAARLLEEGGFQILVVGIEDTVEILIGVGLLMDGSTAEVVGVKNKPQSTTEVVGVGVKHLSLVEVDEGIRVGRQRDDNARGVRMLLRRAEDGLHAIDGLDVEQRLLIEDGTLVAGVLLVEDGHRGSNPPP
jgi:hypothetical protein